MNVGLFTSSFGFFAFFLIFCDLHQQRPQYNVIHILISDKLIIP